MIKLPEPVAYRVDGGKQNERLLQPYEYHFDLVVPKVMCVQLFTEAQLKQAVHDAYEQAAKVCESEYDNWDNERPLRICATTIRALIKEIPE